MSRSAFGDAITKTLKKPEEPAQAAPKESTKVSKTSRDGKVLAGAWINPEAHKQLKRLAVDRDTNIQALLIEAINRTFQEHGLREIA